MKDENPFPADCAQRFVFVRRIAAGGFGAVFQAVQRELDRPVAIKLLLSDAIQDAEQVARFNAEAKVTASLSHPNIIRVLDHGAGSGIPWIAYEYMEGKSLRELLDGHPGGLPLEQACAAATQVAEALEAAHAKGVLHRDVKPENVVEVGAGHHKVLDFGIAQWTGEGAVRTRTGIILGTPAYVSPEQISGAEATAASDLYALGVMFHELVTGQRPYDDANLARVLEKHLKGAIPLPSARRPDLPAEVDDVVRRALAKQPRERYGSAGEMAAALARIADARPTGRAPAPRRRSPGAATARISRPDAPARPATVPLAVPPRRRWPAAAAALLALLAIVGFARRPAPVAVGTPASPASLRATARPSVAPIRPLDADSASVRDGLLVTMLKIADVSNRRGNLFRVLFRPGAGMLPGSADPEPASFEPFLDGARWVGSRLGGSALAPARCGAGGPAIHAGGRFPAGQHARAYDGLRTQLAPPDQGHGSGARPRAKPTARGQPEAGGARTGHRGPVRGAPRTASRPARQRSGEDDVAAVPELLGHPPRVRGAGR